MSGLATATQGGRRPFTSCRARLASLALAALLCWSGASADPTGELAATAGAPVGIAAKWRDLFLSVRGPSALLGGGLRSAVGVGTESVEEDSRPGPEGGLPVRRKWFNATVAWQAASRLTLSASYSHLLLVRPEADDEFLSLGAPPAVVPPMPPAEGRGIICLRASLLF